MHAIIDLAVLFAELINSPPQPAPADHPHPNEARDQPRENLRIPAQVSGSITRMIDEPPRQNCLPLVLSRPIRPHTPLLSMNPRHLLVAISSGTSGLMATLCEFTCANMPNGPRSMISMSTGLVRIPTKASSVSVQLENVESSSCSKWREVERGALSGLPALVAH
ncbi:hypothetical protein BDR05DRAFT_963975 [Suillus weaverae]|nr:hypothetical protein BDR05DRAFT_963975 [Suillus weaverae]